MLPLSTIVSSTVLTLKPRETLQNSIILFQSCWRSSQLQKQLQPTLSTLKFQSLFRSFQSRESIQPELQKMRNCNQTGFNEASLLAASEETLRTMTEKAIESLPFAGQLATMIETCQLIEFNTR
jgi:hypothetical protein